MKKEIEIADRVRVIPSLRLWLLFLPPPADHQWSGGPVLHAWQRTPAQTGGALLSSAAGGQKMCLHLHTEAHQVKDSMKGTGWAGLLDALPEAAGHEWRVAYDKPVQTSPLKWTKRVSWLGACLFLFCFGWQTFTIYIQSRSWGYFRTPAAVAAIGSDQSGRVLWRCSLLCWDSGSEQCPPVGQRAI